MIKLIVILLFLLRSASAVSETCQPPINLRLERSWLCQCYHLLECPTEIHPSQSYESHIVSSLNLDGDIFLVPTYYANTLEKYGLRPILSVSTLTKTYLVTKKQFNPYELSTMIGTTVSLPSKYSYSYLAILERMKAQNIPINSINFKFGNSLQVNALNIIRGKMDAAALFSTVFDPLPDNIKENLNHNILIEGNYAGKILIKDTPSPELIKAIKGAYKNIHLLTWSIDEKPSKQTMYTRQFEKQIQHLTHNFPAKWSIAKTLSILPISCIVNFSQLFVLLSLYAESCSRIICAPNPRIIRFRAIFVNC